MNIFFLDENPRLAAQYHNDTHVNKQIVESCQILSTAIWINNYKDHPVYKDLTKRAKTDEEREYMKQVKQQWKDETGLYVPTHENHPSVVWAAESVDNMDWLVMMALYLCVIHVGNSNKMHACLPLLDRIDIDTSGHYPDHTPFSIGFNKEKYADCITDSVVQSYRNYYKKHKQGYVKNDKFIPYTWTNRDVPEFMK